MNKLLESMDSIITKLEQDKFQYLFAQSDARRILQEVKEANENYPKFDKLLTEKATHIAYLLISCGCTYLENDDSNCNTSKAFELLEKAGQLLTDTYKYKQDKDNIDDYNLLIAGMTLYASKQYSKAFIILKNVNSNLMIGKLIIKFIKKDFRSLLEESSKLFYSDPIKTSSIYDLDIWVINHEIAHCFLLTLDYFQTGNKENINTINSIIEKLVLLSLNGNLYILWTILRLLKIIFSTFYKSSLWENILPITGNNDIVKNYINLLYNFKIPVVEIWPSQLAALPVAIGENEGGIINLRTSAGKTRIAEIAILKTIIENPNAKILYLAPFRSLSFEIEQTMEKVFSPLGVSVSHLYGGNNINSTDFDLIYSSQLIIATPEKVKALIRNGINIEEIKLIICDEGHLLGHSDREIKNEIFLTHVKEYANTHNIRILLLSAVLPNPEELSKWITGRSDLIGKSNWKPSSERLGRMFWNGETVDLSWLNSENTFNKNFITQKYLENTNRRTPFPKNKKEAISATALRLSQNGTVLIYSARANSINGIAESVLEAMDNKYQDYQWEPQLWNIFVNLCQEELPENDVILRAAKKGIICHSDNLPRLVRINIENLMRSKSPLIIIASSTLAQGVNIGISTIIIYTPYISKDIITLNDFWNICGRAGRAFSDLEGKILYAIDQTEDYYKVRHQYENAKYFLTNQRLEKVTSGILSLLTRIKAISEAASIDFSVLIDYIANDFAQDYLDDNLLLELEKCFDLIDDELLSMYEDMNDNDDDLQWIDNIFRNSLAFIQSDNDYHENYINLLKARTRAILTKIPNEQVRKQIISSGLPLSIATSINRDIAGFKDLVSPFLTEGIEQLDTMNYIIKNIESWVRSNCTSILKTNYEENTLDLVRKNWISGTPLTEVVELKSNTVHKIAKDYYEYTLSWILHAISKNLNQDTEQDYIEVFSLLASVVELGLPNKTAINIYLAGIKSRSVALELSLLNIFHDKKIFEIKSILVGHTLDELNLSDTAKAWIDFVYNEYKEALPKTISFPHFKLNEENTPDTLYLRKSDTGYVLSSADGSMFYNINSNSELPFENLIDLRGVYFKKIQDYYQIESYSPMIICE